MARRRTYEPPPDPIALALAYRVRALETERDLIDIVLPYVEALAAINGRYQPTVEMLERHVEALAPALPAVPGEGTETT